MKTSIHGSACALETLAPGRKQQSTAGYHLLDVASRDRLRCVAAQLTGRPVSFEHYDAGGRSPGRAPVFPPALNQEIVRHHMETAAMETILLLGWMEQTSHSHTSVRTALTFPAIPKLRRRVFGVSIAPWLARCRPEPPPHPYG